jgi:phosphoribosyl-dephospho-CoA transferase
MEPSLTVGLPAPTHELLRVSALGVVTAEGQTPNWVAPALQRAPWVVVRRGWIQGARIPIGLRGGSRAHRFAAWLAVADIAERRSPEELWNDSQNRPALGMSHTREEALAVLSALSRVAPLLERRGIGWGPVGSVGFELATGAATITASSDIDIMLRQNDRIDRREARALHTALVEAALPSRLDALVETPNGGVALGELAATTAKVLLRTPDGVRLVEDPWTESPA